MAAHHLIVHWEWVEALTSRFFGRTTDQVRMYYLIDFGLLVGFILIFITGLIISTWFRLPLENYLVFRNWHIAISVSRLLLEVIKIAAHWRWIVKTLRNSGNFAKTSQIAPQPALVLVNTGRRDFLKLMGVVSAAAFLAATSALDQDGVTYAVD